MKTFKEYVFSPWESNGMSALCIYRFAHDNPGPNNIPYDPDDWSRCLQVLRIVCHDEITAIKRVLQELGNYYHSAEWKALAQHYDELMSIFTSEWDTNSAPKTYAYMQKIYEEAKR